jgi:glucose/arabinose dehydrogenase
MGSTLRAAAVLLSLVPATAAAQAPRPLVTGLTNPASVAIGTDGRVYVTTADKGGAVLVVSKGTAAPFAAGLGEPRGLAAWREWLFVVDRQRVWRVGRTGKAEVFAAAGAFPAPPASLQDVAADEPGNLYVTDAGDGPGKAGAVYRIGPQGKVLKLGGGAGTPALRSPRGVALDGESFLLVVDAASGDLFHVRIADGRTARVAGGFGSGDGLAFDWHGRLYLSDSRQGRVWVIARPGAAAVPRAAGPKAPGDLCLAPGGKALLVTDRSAGTLTALPAQVPGAEVDETLLPLETAVAFPRLRWAGWTGESKAGLIVPLRPIVLTHAGDGTDRVFVATQHGVIHVFPNDQNAAETRVFLDIRERVRYRDETNEEGFLGLAFHPEFKRNGEFFVFYTPSKAKLTNVLSRFRVRRDDPGRADPASEEELLRVQRPFWNHDGGTLCFGPDGYLYVALGDGGDAGDPFGNGQNLGQLLGKVLRLDVNRKEAGKPYAIPRDNPFVGRKGARPETWAYGLRNVWRMAFDRKTGRLWAGDVGQNLWEEIDILVAGGNYGWNLREGLHPFGARGTGPHQDVIEPIWEYHHDLGKCIIGGLVYRGRRLPELDGAYLYADYVTGALWALRYDEVKKRVIANRPIRDRKLPVLSFGEDEQGEVYFLTASPTGQGIHRFVRPAPGGRKK